MAIIAIRANDPNLRELVKNSDCVVFPAGAIFPTAEKHNPMRSGYIGCPTCGHEQSWYSKYETYGIIYAGECKGCGTFQSFSRRYKEEVV